MHALRLKAIKPKVKLLSVSVFVFLQQIRVDGSSLALQYETVQAVDSGPILRDMAFSSDHHYLYVMSETQVRGAQTEHAAGSPPTRNQQRLSLCYVTG